MISLYVGGERVELRDESGAVLGDARPATEPLVPWDPTITRAELRRRVAQGGGMKLADFWKQMGV